jgi:hypothetical protein
MLSFRTKDALSVLEISLTKMGTIILMKYHHFLQDLNLRLLLIMMTQIICIQIMKKVCGSNDNRKKILNVS